MRAATTSSPSAPIIESLRVLRIQEVADHLRVSRATLHRMRQRGDLPSPVRISRRCVGWPVPVIQRWLMARDERPVR